MYIDNAHKNTRKLSYTECINQLEYAYIFYSMILWFPSLIKRLQYYDLALKQWQVMICYSGYE